MTPGGVSCYQVGQLYSASDVECIVRKIHYREQDFEDGDLGKRLNRFNDYILREVSLSECDRGSYYIDEEAVQEMSEEDPLTMPPIVLGFKYGDHYDVVDGNHRVEASALQHRETILAFVGHTPNERVDENEEEEEEDD